MNKEKLSAFCHFYSQDFPWPRRPWATPSLVRDAPWIWCIKPPSTGLRPLAKSNYGVVNHGKPKNHHYISIPNTFKTFNTSICVTGVNRVFFFCLCFAPSAISRTRGIPCWMPRKAAPQWDVRRAESTRSPACLRPPRRTGPRDPRDWWLKKLVTGTMDWIMTFHI